MIRKVICLLLFCAVSFAANNPNEMLEQVSDALVKDLSKQENLEDSHEEVAKIIRNVLLPKIDKYQMSKSVVGPRYWESATASQQNEFISEFETMVTNNYARLFTNYTNQKITFMPYRGNYNEKSRIEIKSLVTSTGKNNFKVYYKLVKDPAGSWLIYDFSIDGISMVESYRSQFAPLLKDSGLSGLVVKMKQFNSKSD